MNILLDPSIAYLLLVFGTILLMMAFLTPGTHVLEIGALFLLALAGFSIYQIGSFTIWALVVLIISLVPFIYAIQKPKRELFLAVSFLLFIIGSIYLFPSKGFVPSVNPILAVIVSIFTVGFLWLVTRNSIKANAARPLNDPEVLIGKLGQAKTGVHEEGTVQVASELWSARSDRSIPAGSWVRVVRREGFILIVEADNQRAK